MDSSTWQEAIRLDTSGLTHQTSADEYWGKASREGVQILTLQSARIRVRVQACALGINAPSVVFSCDPPNVIEHYDTLFELLHPWANVVCYESPGFGFSTVQASFDFSPEMYEAAIVEMLEALALPEYVLIAPCVSVYSALSIALKYPTLVSRLVLMQAPVWAEEIKWAARLDPNGILRTPSVGQHFIDKHRHKVAQSWYPVALADATQSDTFLAPVLDSFAHQACYCLASLLQTWFANPSQDAPMLEGVSQPTWVIWGNGDASHTPTDKRSILAYIPNAVYEEWNDAGHFPELEQSQRFADRLREFCGR